ncbi:helix-turn-helix domain-containing protein [Streptosporangium sp. NBC_01469]|uniref:helix-turn-helix domain-containing protein n=1 Tax=Streptosporangium sp. NBC_01469 TaxID=2903898 RepID=UPI002E2954F2|nr:hypothetical protein [Streptosporangium sp. NBC_01469]
MPADPRHTPAETVPAHERAAAAGATYEQAAGAADVEADTPGRTVTTAGAETDAGTPGRTVTAAPAETDAGTSARASVTGTEPSRMAHVRARAGGPLPLGAGEAAPTGMARLGRGDGTGLALPVWPDGATPSLLEEYQVAPVAVERSGETRRVLAAALRCCWTDLAADPWPGVPATVDDVLSAYRALIGRGDDLMRNWAVGALRRLHDSAWLEVADGFVRLGPRCASWPTASHAQLRELMRRLPAGEKVPGGLEVLPVAEGALDDALDDAEAGAGVTVPEEVDEDLLGPFDERRRAEVVAAFMAVEHAAEPVHEARFSALRDPMLRRALAEMLERRGRVLIHDRDAWTSGYAPETLAGAGVPSEPGSGSGSGARSGAGTTSGAGTGARSGAGTTSGAGTGARSGAGTTSGAGTGARSGAGTTSGAGTGARSGAGTGTGLTSGAGSALGESERAVLVLVLIHSVAIPRADGLLPADSWLSPFPAQVDELRRHTRLPVGELDAALRVLRHAGLVTQVKAGEEAGGYVPGPQFHRLTPQARRRLQEELILAAGPHTPLAAAVRANRR